MTWASFADSGVNGARTLNASYNVTSVSRTAAGTMTVTFTTAFASAAYSCSGNIIASGPHAWVEFQTQAAGSIGFIAVTSVPIDFTTGFVECPGRQ
jgi:hypothetical protein